jgi:hypothetical protein
VESEVDRLRREIRALAAAADIYAVTIEVLQLQLAGIYTCPMGHKSSVTRLPNAEGVRRCFFCGQVAETL